MVMLGLDERVQRGIPARLIDVVGQRIVTGGWPPGSAFRIQDLQDEFQVSVTVAREVVLALQSKGLVESRPKRGVTILERDSWNLLDPDVLSWDATGRGRLIADLEQARLLIEPWAAAAAAVRQSSEVIARCRRAMTAMRQSTLKADVDAITAADVEFHRALLEASGNAIITQVGALIEPILRRRDEMTFSETPSDDIAFLDLHERVISAIEAGDERTAELASRELVQASASDSSQVTAAKAAKERGGR